ncbi:MAG TPA: hypothetical protein VGM62_19695 [Chthoniobacterales bacterium]|jgi:hypothetical protein
MKKPVLFYAGVILLAVALSFWLNTSNSRRPARAPQRPKAAAKKCVKDKNGKEWPECVPPNHGEPFADFNNNLTVNGVQYFCSDEGRWVVNKKAWLSREENASKQADLLVALGSRKLSHEELMRVTPTLNIFEMQPYFACVKYAELYDLLLKQWELQKGQSLPVKLHLSRELGEYNQCPQEYDNRVAVEGLITDLQDIQ